MKKDRTKNRPTPKQDKWRDPFYYYARKHRSGSYVNYRVLEKLRFAAMKGDDNEKRPNQKQTNTKAR